MLNCVIIIIAILHVRKWIFKTKKYKKAFKHKTIDRTIEHFKRQNLLIEEEHSSRYKNVLSVDTVLCPKSQSEAAKTLEP